MSSTVRMAELAIHYLGSTKISTGVAALPWRSALSHGAKFLDILSTLDIPSPALILIISQNFD